MRRQYFHYCRTHKDELAGESGGVDLADDEEVDAHFLHSFPTFQFQSLSKPSKVMTTASTLDPVKFGGLDDGFDETGSVTTMAASIFEHKTYSFLSVPKLTDVATPGEEFECPYCWRMHRFNGQRG